MGVKQAKESVDAAADEATKKADESLEHASNAEALDAQIPKLKAATATIPTVVPPALGALQKAGQTADRALNLAQAATNIGQLATAERMAEAALVSATGASGQIDKLASVVQAAESQLAGLVAKAVGTGKAAAEKAKGDAAAAKKAGEDEVAKGKSAAEKASAEKEAKTKAVAEKQKEAKGTVRKAEEGGKTAGAGAAAAKEEAEKDIDAGGKEDGNA